MTLPITPPPPVPPCPGRFGCGWTDHGKKHFPYRGLKREYTRHRAARYLPGTTAAQIQAIETATVAAPTRVLTPPPGNSEYLRDVGQVIGWDDGQDATLSFAECSGGLTAGRAFHGRPMAWTNPKLRDCDVGE